MAAPAHAPALAPGPSSLLRGLRAVRRHLPEGGGLPDDARRRRHQGILTLLWLHVPGIFLFGLVQRADVGHLLLEVLPIAAAAATAGQLSHRRVLSTVVASTGLVTASGVIVHLSGGVIEAHFHFFVMVGVVVLYQEWWPFLVAIGYVVLHHGTLGTMASHSVYNHDAAINNPWKWAVVHGAFILGMSAAGIVTWRLNESLRKAAVASEHHLAEAQQLARLGSWELDVRTQELAASDELNRMFGFSPVESPAVERFVERVHPEDRAQLTRWVNEASRTRTPMAIDFRVVKDGEVRSFHARGQTVVDETGAITKLRGTTQDITERKVIEEALSRESMVRRLLQTVAVAANEARTVPAAMQVAVEQVCKFTGWPVGHAFLSCGPGEPLVSAGVWHLSEPDRFEGFRRATERTALPVGSGFAGRVSFTGVPAWITDLSKEEPFTRRDAALQVGLRSAVAFPLVVGEEPAGVVEFFSTTAEPVDDELLEVMVQIGRQLSLVLERTRATEALQASEQRNRRIVETASDAFLAMDESGRVVEWNQQAELLFGWSREEALGREAAELIVAEELGEAYPEGLRGYLSIGSGPVVSNRMNLEAKHRDGDRFPVELAVWEITTPSGRELNAFVRDISRQKETEEALASARDQAIEASRLKSEFLANMSHEIRTPMNGVIGLANLLLDTDLDGPQRRYAEGIQSAGEALLGLINDILDLSKAEAGKIELEQVDFDLQELVEEATTLLAGPAAEKGLELVGYTDPSLPRAVRGDPGRVRQVLVNLVGNAVKFTERGEVVVRALGERLDDRAVLARFEVRDTGIGIDAPVQARLFQPFTQADASTTRRYGGTGLGLALSKRLVELMGGAIGVQSEPRAGSTFWFTVPFETRAEPPTERALPQAPPSVGTVRALVVDDNATNRLILEQQLCSWGLRVDSEEDPRRALELARAAAATGEPYGVALLDLQMPEMSGLELAEAMGRELGLGQPAVILLSSVGAVSSADRTLNGVRLSLMKPIRQSELFNSLAQVLGRGTEPAIDGDDRAREEAERTSGGHGAVLVVEDNSINRTVALGTLAKLGYQADVAVNGREAVEAVRRRAYSAVLMDCQMPEMDGYEATREIREREDGVRHVPIIAMTAAAMAGDRERCLQAGMDDYIAKPLRLEDVDAALRRWTSETLPPGERVPPPPRQDGEAVLDCSHLEELRSLGAQTGNADMFEELVGALVQELPARLSEVQAAARREDLDALGRIAHRVTGSLATLGARRAASASAALEAAARGTDAAAVAERLHDFEVELDTAVKALERAAAREHRPDG